MSKRQPVFVDGPGNDDWIKTSQSRAAEAAAHAEVERRLKAKRK